MTPQITIYPNPVSLQKMTPRIDQNPVFSFFRVQLRPERGEARAERERRLRRLRLLGQRTQHLIVIVGSTSALEGREEGPRDGHPLLRARHHQPPHGRVQRHALPARAQRGPAQRLQGHQTEGQEQGEDGEIRVWPYVFRIQFVVGR